MCVSLREEGNEHIVPVSGRPSVNRWKKNLTQSNNTEWQRLEHEVPRKHRGGTSPVLRRGGDKRGQSAKAFMELDSTGSRLTDTPCKTRKSWTMKRKWKGYSVFQDNCNEEQLSCHLVMHRFMKLEITGREETVRRLQRETHAWGETERPR